MHTAISCVRILRQARDLGVPHTLTYNMHE